MQTPAHHIANGVAIVVPGFSIWGAVHDYLPWALGIVLTLMGIAWYGVLFYDRFKKGESDVPSNPHQAG